MGWGFGWLVFYYFALVYFFLCSLFFTDFAVPALTCGQGSEPRGSAFSPSASLQVLVMFVQLILVQLLSTVLLLLRPTTVCFCCDALGRGLACSSYPGDTTYAAMFFSYALTLLFLVLV